MFDIGWTEMLVVAVVAILVVGPKDLPGMLRNFGRMIKKVRGMASDFQQQFNEAIEDTGLDDVKKSIDQVRNLDPTKQIKDRLNPLKDTSEKNSDVSDEKPKSYDYDPNELFDAEKDPAVTEPVKIDVDEALARQEKLNVEAKATKTKLKKSTTAKKSPPAKKTATQKSASKKASTKKPAAKRPAAKKPAKAKA